MSNLILMASQQSPGASQSGSLIYTLAPFVLIFVIFYLLLIRPQQKKQKDHQKLLTELKKGDRVVTSSGMFGVISSFNEEKNLVILRLDENVKVEFLKSSIAGKVD